MSRLQASALQRRPAADRRRGGRRWPPSPASAPARRASTIDVPETLPDVLADAALLERALANLVGNAVRYAPAGAPVRVTAGEVVGDGQPRVDVRVIDRGPGIRPADRELVFQPFQRLVDHQADGAGVGLGLAIARGFVEAMGGELAIEDTPGRRHDDGRRPAGRRPERSP